MKHTDLKIRILTRSASFIGQVILDFDHNTNDAARYLIVGMSHNEIALSRLFKPGAMNELLFEKCCRISLKDQDADDGAPITLFADTTKLISKDLGSVMPLLNKRKGKHSSRISKSDIHLVLSRMKACNTIPESIKDKFLLSF